VRVGWKKIFAALLVGVALGWVADDAFAQGRRRSRDKDKEKGPTCNWGGEAVQKRRKTAFELYLAEKYKEAKAEIAKFNMDRLPPCARFELERVLASVEHELKNEKGAREHLERAIQFGEPTPEQQADLRFQIAQLWMGEEKWKEAIDSLDKWFALTPNPNSQAYYLRAICKYQLEDFKGALPDAEKAIELSAGNPQESWLQLLLALRIQREEYKLAIPLLEQLVSLSPGKKNYWLQLSSVHGQLGSYAEALVPLQLAYHAGLLTEDSELRRLAQLLIHVGIPFRATRILTQGLEKGVIKADVKYYELLGNSYITARDYGKALDPLRKGGEMSSDGKLYLRLAEVLVQREEWGPASDALRRAIDKGGLSNPGQAMLLMGIVQYNQKKSADARNWFQRASQHSTTRDQAEKWLSVLQQQS
jgi:tetratricopeptide (TPR) repeat protein